MFTKVKKLVMLDDLAVAEAAMAAEIVSEVIVAGQVVEVAAEVAETSEARLSAATNDDEFQKIMIMMMEAVSAAGPGGYM